MTRVKQGLAAAVVIALATAACGGDSSSTPTAPTPPQTPPTTGGGGTVTDSATITIGTNGSVSPSTVTITRGGRVTFVNNHTRPHDMNSDPHPEHTQCPELNVGSLTVGQTKATQNLTTARRCGFHDHLDSGNASLQGSITIQ